MTDATPINDYQITMSFTARIDGEDVEYEVDLGFNEESEQYTAEYIIGGNVRHRSAGTSVNRALARLADSMNGEILDAIDNA